MLNDTIKIIVSIEKKTLLLTGNTKNSFYLKYEITKTFEKTNKNIDWQRSTSTFAMN